MFITKKAFNEAIAKAKEEVSSEYERQFNMREENRWRDERERDLNNRINSAFADIDRRLNALEKAGTPRGDVAVCSRY